MNILLLDNWGEKARSALEEVATVYDENKHVGVAKTATGIRGLEVALEKDIDGIIYGLNHRMVVTPNTKKYWDRYSKLKFIATGTTGTDHLDLDYCKQRGIEVISLAGEPGLKDVYATAEHTFALILSLIRKVPFAFDDVKQGNWNRDAWQGSELRGKTLGIVGFGRVGQQVARIAEGFGMQVFTQDKRDEKEWWYRDHCKSILRLSDIITVHVDLNETNRGMFGREQFAMMKPTAYFINTSRGQIVDEVALYHALAHNQIAGAAIDVMSREPKLTGILYDYATHTENEYDNLIITPHIAGNTTESREKTQMMLAEKIKAYANSRAVLTEETCYSHRKAGVCDGAI